MIGYLSGNIKDIEKDKIILVVGGVGYVVYVPSREIEGLEIGQDISLLIRTIAKDNDISLFGFLTREEIQLFDLLIKVSGIGPKKAITILGVREPQDAIYKIREGNSDALSETLSISKKMAEKIILEIRNKVDALDKSERNENEDVIDALMNLGYKRVDAIEATKSIKEGGVSSRIKEALINLSKDR